VGCAATAVAKVPLLAANVAGTHVFLTAEETATLRHALDNANGVLGDVEWDELTVALAQVTNCERNWNRGHQSVRKMASEM
jgi:hypothetical protein